MTEWNCNMVVRRLTTPERVRLYTVLSQCNKGVSFRTTPKWVAGAFGLTGFGPTRERTLEHLRNRINKHAPKRCNVL